MKKLLFLFFLIFNKFTLAQTVQVNNIILFPANPSNIDTIYAIADLVFDHDNCQLNNYYLTFNGNDVTLNTKYCLGNNSSNCYVIDTFNLGVFSTGNYYFNFSLAIIPNNCVAPAYTIYTDLIDTVDVGTYTITVENKSIDKFTILANPTTNSTICIKANNINPFQISCFNSIGNLIFERNNVIDTENIFLPNDKGIYMLRIVDSQNQLHFFKCISN